ncbi:MAG: bifunctional riboflavin kinase/FMN adenylyltransferase [Phycisphaeraceae bacterium]|nr:bifunctional riboflavin kinase/FMN adenylyltransferase [Phycisphaeraceae bacterium]
MNGRHGTVVIIGNFDGVHIGHAELVRRARTAGGGGASRVVAMTFDPHPLARIQPSAAPARLTTFERRAALLSECGVDEVIRLQPSAALLALTPEEFIEHVVRDVHPVAIVEGQDFRFGKGRAGDVETLRQLGTRHGFSVHIVPPVEAVMTDGMVAPASSTLARWLLSHGRVKDAAAVLGREYELDGIVVKGDQRGRQLGYPTANLGTECLLPADGVYAGWAVLPDGREVPAAISVGTKPMFGGVSRLLEAHLLGKPDVSRWSEYGWPIRVRVSRWLRDQMMFESVESLIRQIEADCRRAMPEGAVTA